MKTLILILTLISFTCLAQQQTRKFGIVEYTDTSDSIVIRKLITKVITPKDGMTIKFLSPPDSARLLIPDDGFMYETTMSFKRVGAVPPPVEPGPDIITIIDNIDAQNVYSSGWVQHANKDWTQVFNDKTVAVTYQVNGTLTVPFDGYKIEWWGEKRFNHGKVAVSIGTWNGDEYTYGPETTKDLYDVTDKNNSQVIFDWTSPVNGKHSIKLRLTNEKHPSSTSINVVHDSFVVYKK